MKKRRVFSIFSALMVTTTVIMGSSAVADDVGKSPDSSITTTFNVAKESKFRSDYGLESSIDLSKQRSLEPVSIEFGVRLTQEEAAGLKERFAFLDNTVPKIKQILKNKVSDDYVIYVDQKQGGVVNIGLKNPNINIDDIKASFIDATKLRIFKIDKSEKDLVSIEDQIWNDKEALFNNDKIDISNTDVDVVSGEVSVGVNGNNQQITDYFKNKFGNAVEVHEAKADVGDANRASTWNPIQGGAKVSYSTSSSCSVGFSAMAGGSKFIVTAGHCYKSGTTYYQGSSVLGTMVAKNGTSGYSADAGMIGVGPAGVTYGGGKIYYDGTTTTQYTSTQNASEDYIGQTVCMSGASSDANPVTCQQITSTNYSTTIDGASLTRLRKAYYTSNPGDSGGTVFIGGVLIGINTGHTGDGLEAIYSHLQYVLSTLSSVYGSTVSPMF